MVLSNTLKLIKAGQVIRVDSPDAIKWLPEAPKPENCRNCGAPPDDGHACSYCGTPRV